MPATLEEWLVLGILVNIAALVAILILKYKEI